MEIPESDSIKQVVRIAAPCIVEQLLITTVGMVSVSIIGHLGGEELVASSMTNQLVMWIQSMYIGLGTGGAVVIARMWGGGEEEGVKRGFNQNLLLGVSLSLVLAVLMLVFERKITQGLFGGADARVLDLIHMYFPYCIYSMPAIAVSTIITGSARGVGDNKTPLYSVIMLDGVNMALCFVLVNGVSWLGIPRLGMLGAGIAAVTARYLNAVFTVLRVIAIKSPILPKRLQLRFDKPMLYKMFKISVPSAFEQVVFQGGFVILQTLLIGFGTLFQGGYQIGANINGLINGPAMGISVAMTVLTSQAIGEQNIVRAQKLVDVSRLLVFTAFVAMGGILFVAAPFIARIFTPDAEILRVGTIFARFFGVLIIPLAYFQTIGGILRGSGDVKFVLLVNIASLWLIRILAIWALARLTGNGYIAVMVGITCDFLMRAASFHIRIQRGTWKYIRI
ncbi:MATE family efflux transporter [Clostridia bacterium]|nr:MATE family efflux transporter [Clostridia bacterium]